MAKQINPVQAVRKMLGNGYCGINKANELCYEVCAAFQGDNIDANLVPKECGKECEKMINDLRMQKWGLTKCEHAGPWKPLIRDGPVFFPKLYSDSFRDGGTGDKEGALRECEKMCKDTVYPGECKERCLLHSYAIPDGEGYSSLQGFSVVEKIKSPTGLFVLLVIIVFLYFFFVKR